MSEDTWGCPRCQDGDETCECGAQHTCPATWEKEHAQGWTSKHWPKRLGGCQRRSSPGEEKP